MEEGDERLLAEKGDIHHFVSSSCTSGKKWIRVGHGREPRPVPRNQSSSREGSGLGGVHTSSPMLTAARESMAFNSGSDSAVATTPKGGSPAKSLSSEDDSPSPDAAIDIWSSIGAPNETLGTPWDGSAKSPGSCTEQLLWEKWEVCGDWPDGEALTVTLRSPRALAGGPLLVADKPGWVVTEGAPPTPLRRERRDHSAVMVIRSQWRHEPSTNAVSECWMPRHWRQQSWSLTEDR